MNEESDRFVAATQSSRGLLYRMARRGGYDHHQAEDVVQETYLRAYAAFAGHRGPSTQAWLAAICRNVMRSDRRRRSRRVGEEPLDGVHPTAPDPGPTDLAIASVEVEALRRALTLIPEHHRIAVVAMDLAGWSAAEIAAASGRPRNTVLSWSRRGRLKLAALLGESASNPQGRMQSAAATRRQHNRTTPSRQRRHP